MLIAIRGVIVTLLCRGKLMAVSGASKVA